MSVFPYCLLKMCFLTIVSKNDVFAVCKASTFKLNQKQLAINICNECSLFCSTGNSFFTGNGHLYSEYMLFMFICTVFLFLWFEFCTIEVDNPFRNTSVTVTFYIIIYIVTMKGLNLYHDMNFRPYLSAVPKPFAGYHDL